MNNHPNSHLNLASGSSHVDQIWDHTDPPPVTLKQLSQNLSFLENQYHTKVRKRNKQKIQSQSLPIRKNHCKENSLLPRIFSSKYAVDLSKKKNKRSTSLVKELSTAMNRQESSACCDKKRGGRQFSEMRGLFPLEGKEQNLFLHKHKVMNISRALNLTKIRNKKSHKIFYSTLENEIAKYENVKISQFTQTQSKQ